MNFAKKAFRRIPNWIWRDIALPFFASRVMLVLVAWLGLYLVHHEVVFSGAFEFGRDGAQRPVMRGVSPDLPLINMWARWDATWYLSIAREGYSYDPDKFSNTAFFPLYPLTIRIVHAAFFFLSSHDAGWALAGIFVSNAALIAALIYLTLLVRLDFDSGTASRAVLYLCVFPSTLFLSAVYSESLFLLAIVAAFYYARRGRWLVAGVVGAAAALCRPPGFLLCLPLAFEYFAQRKFNWRSIRIDILYIGLIPLALFAHLFFLRSQFGTWDILQRSQGAWNRSFTLPPFTLRNVILSAHPIDALDVPAIDLGFFLLLLAAAIVSAFRLRASYTIYAFVALFFLSNWTTLHSMSRLGLMIFPVLILLATLGKNENFDRSFLVVSTGLAAFFMLLFSQWVWVA